MERYRAAFFLTLTTTVLLGAALTVTWLKPAWVASVWSGGRTPSVGAPTAAAATDPAHPAQNPMSEPSLVSVTLSPERMQTIGVKTGAAEYKDVHDEIRTTGNVEVDETHLAEVQVRFSGWIQQVFADATFKQIQKGQPLLTIYSPELVTTQNEYLLAKQNRDLLARSTVPVCRYGGRAR